MTQHLNLPRNEMICLRGVAIRGYDFQRIPQPRLFNNILLNGYFHLIESRSKSENFPSVKAFDCLFFPVLFSQGYEKALEKWPRHINLFEYEILLIPIHIPGVSCDHWALIVVFTKLGIVEYFDSVYGEDMPRLETVVNFLHKESGFLGVVSSTVWLVRSASSLPRQKGSNNCGAFVCLFAEHVSRNAHPRFSQEDMLDLRYNIGLDLLEGKLAHSVCDMMN